MLRAVVSGPADRLDEAIRGLVLGMEFHPMPASEVFGRGELVTPTGEDPYRPALSSVLALLTKLGIKPAFGEFEGRATTSKAARNTSPPPPARQRAS